MSSAPTTIGTAAWLQPFAEAAERALTTNILPFWQRTLDETRGGIFNCWTNDNTRCLSRDKFTWSQGRFAWLWSRIAQDCERGVLKGDGGDYLAQAGRTVRFLAAHAFLGDGRCAFLLSEDGQLKEAIPGGGPAPSGYADCFVVMGFAEYARASGDVSWLDRAWTLFEHIESRIAAGTFLTHPEPIPDGYASHAVAMITLNLALVLGDACDTLADARRARAHERARRAAAAIFDQFLQPDGRIVELRPRDAAASETLLSRHLNPGHALEGLWMLLTVARRECRGDWIARALAAVEFTLLRSWDDEYGGLLHYVDRAGGPPRGDAGESAYERGVRGTWDTKLWWVHSEALYTTALAAVLGDRVDRRAAFERVWRYTFATFPHPDPRIGEWIQIRDRRGAPLDRVVALPVKDPYHIARNLLQLVELGRAVPSPAS